MCVLNILLLFVACLVVLRMFVRLPTSRAEHPSWAGGVTVVGSPYCELSNTDAPPGEHSFILLTCVCVLNFALGVVAQGWVFKLMFERCSSFC